MGKEAFDRKVSCHFAWSYHMNDFVQMVPLDCQANHAGASKYDGRKHCNEFSIGIELPGPFGGIISHDVMQKLDILTTKIKSVINITDCCGHCHIAPGRRMDPGKEFKFKEFCLKHDLIFKGEENG